MTTAAFSDEYVIVDALISFANQNQIGNKVHLYTREDGSLVAFFTVGSSQPQETLDVTTLSDLLDVLDEVSWAMTDSLGFLVVNDQHKLVVTQFQFHEKGVVTHELPPEPCYTGVLKHLNAAPALDQTDAEKRVTGYHHALGYFALTPTIINPFGSHSLRVLTHTNNR